MKRKGAIILLIPLALLLGTVALSLFSRPVVIHNTAELAKYTDCQPEYIRQWLQHDFTYKLQGDIYPSGAGVFAHSIAERQNSASEDTCDILPGGKCWCTGGYLIADEVLKTLVTMGSDGVWHQLESYYQEWIADEPVKEPGDG